MADHVDSSDLAHDMRETARRFRDHVLKEHGVSLGHSKAAFCQVDSLLADEAAGLEGDESLVLAMAVAAFLGEELIGEFGGAWEFNDRFGPTVAGCVGRQQVHITAIAHVRLMNLGVELPLEAPRLTVYRAWITARTNELESFASLHAQLSLEHQQHGSTP